MLNLSQSLIYPSYANLANKPKVARWAGSGSELHYASYLPIYRFFKIVYGLYSMNANHLGQALAIFFTSQYADNTLILSRNIFFTQLTRYTMLLVEGVPCPTMTLLGSYPPVLHWHTYEPLVAH